MRRRRDFVLAGALCVSWAAGCAVRGRSASATSQPAADPAAGPSGAAGALSPVLAAQQAAWSAFREQVRQTAWYRFDTWYTQFAAAIPREDPTAYRAYFTQADAKDADTRANGYVGMTASNPEAAAVRLSKLLRREDDPYNRTIIVWCLRFIGGERATGTLWDFLGSAADVDFGLCLETQGQIVSYPAAFPLASVEAFKALIVLKGADRMLDGPGWTHLMQRLSRHVDPQPLRLDARRLTPDPARPRETDEQRAERLMRQLDQGGDTP